MKAFDGLDFIYLQTFRTHIQDITCLNQIINYRGYTFLNMQPEFRLAHISRGVIFLGVLITNSVEQCLEIIFRAVVKFLELSMGLNVLGFIIYLSLYKYSNNI
jgi:hypothetical protein